MIRALSDNDVFDAYALVRGRDECWGWSGYKNPDGYGQVFRRGRTLRAHRLSYLLFRGDILPGQVVRHRCDNRECVNPAHLELGTSSDNTADRDQRGRTARGETSGRAKLTEADVRELRRRFVTEQSDMRLADEFGVSPATIWHIRVGRSWAHVREVAA